MQQHPVPQHISSYEFKLVGDMTLKQFFQLAGGIGIALLFYATALPAFIKWPFILFFSLLGTALAFLPFEERPLSAWIFAFFKAVYSPTRYVWSKGQAEEVFPKEAAGQDFQIAAPSQFSPAETVSEFEKNEAHFVQKVTEMFQVGPQQESVQTVPQTSTQRVVVEVEEEKDKSEIAIPKIEPIRLETVTPVTPVFNQPPAPNLQTQQPVFTSQGTPPAPPQIANTIAGQVLDRENRIVEGAILEIRDSNNLPVRALKSNKAGHFLTVTPLPNGEYVITTEKDGLEFSPVKFVATSSIIPPILIRAQVSK